MTILLLACIACADDVSFAVLCHHGNVDVTWDLGILDPSNRYMPLSDVSWSLPQIKGMSTASLIGWRPNSTASRLEMLPWPKSIEHVDFSNSRMSAADLAKILRALPTGVESLNLRGTSVDDTHLAIMRRFPSIVSLDCSCSKVSTEGIRELSALKRLKELNIMMTRVENDVIDVLEQLDSLRTLNIAANDIPKSSLRSLVQATDQVEDLSLDALKWIGDEEVEVVVEGCPRIRRLSVVSTAITEASLQRILAAKHLVWVDARLTALDGRALAGKYRFNGAQSIWIDRDNKDGGAIEIIVVEPLDEVVRLFYSPHNIRQWTGRK